MLRSGGTPGFTQHNGGDVLQARLSNAGDPVDGVVELTTQITGLADGNYDVYAFFWEQVTSTSQNWGLSAGLTSGDLTDYSSAIGPIPDTNTTDPVNANTLSFTNAPAIVAVDGLQEMYGILLGQVQVSGGSAINVYIDHVILNQNQRAIYDGVGYELSTALPGDTDGDGDVDDADLGTSFSNYTGPGGTGKTSAEGDTDNDGDVDDGDLGVSFSAYTGPLGPAVPEPTSLALLGLGGLLVARRRRA